MSFLTDLRRAVRSLRRAPGYTATVVATLAVAIGANSAIFGAVYAVLLRPLPVTEPDDLAVLWQTDEGGQAVVELTYRHLQEWRAAGKTFTGAAVMASHNWDGVLDGRGAPSGSGSPASPGPTSTSSASRPCWVAACGSATTCRMARASRC